ncbi:hypothetical protein [uncultured Thermanaerothrix sp.]|uniref:hypothetical protein n=1 Tax=uncultured Thermanaerothrix sp. TaxID=1195149 RepID=UPI002615511E|nr:hypothetical protein [uncultured Thermanaerothrix sp.]
MQKIKNTLVLLILLYGILYFVAAAPAEETSGQLGRQSLSTPGHSLLSGESEPQSEEQVKEAIQLVSHAGLLLKEFTSFLAEFYRFFLAALHWIAGWNSDFLDALMGFVCLRGIVLAMLGRGVLSISSRVLNR